MLLIQQQTKPTFLPSQEVCTPVHIPSDVHSRTFDPFKLNPSSQVNITLLG